MKSDKYGAKKRYWEKNPSGDEEHTPERESLSSNRHRYPHNCSNCSLYKNVIKSGWMTTACTSTEENKTWRDGIGCSAHSFLRKQG